MLLVITTCPRCSPVRAHGALALIVPLGLDLGRKVLTVPGQIWQLPPPPQRCRVLIRKTRTAPLTNERTIMGCRGFKTGTSSSPLVGQTKVNKFFQHPRNILGYDRQGGWIRSSYFILYWPTVVWSCYRV